MSRRFKQLQYFAAWNGKSTVGWREGEWDGGIAARSGADQCSEGTSQGGGWKGSQRETKGGVRGSVGVILIGKQIIIRLHQS